MGECGSRAGSASKVHTGLLCEGTCSCPGKLLPGWGGEGVFAEEWGQDKPSTCYAAIVGAILVPTGVCVSRLGVGEANVTC